MQMLGEVGMANVVPVDPPATADVYYAKEEAVALVAQWGGRTRR